ncbi:MAG: TonB family protein [Terriglobales bacterium]
MLDNNNPAQPAGAEAPASTTEQLLRLLGQQPMAPNGDDDALNNPELEQLFGSLSKGLEQGIADNALGTPAGEPLTLEALAASLGQPLALAEIPAAQTAREAAVACPKCGLANPAATRFCGMCGQGLGAEAPKASANGAKPVVAASDLPTLTQLGGRTSSSMGFKMAFLGAGILVLGLVVYQQQWWRLPLRTGVISNVAAVQTSSRAAEPPAEAAPAPAKQPEAVNRAPATVIRTPVTVVKPSKAAPPTVITRNLPQPMPLPSASLPLQIPLPVVPPAAATESVEQPPVEKAPAAAPESAAPEPKPASISQSVPGVLTHKVNPQYPAAARAARVQGAVVMSAIIGADGTIQQLRVISGNPLLVNAAMEAVKKWRYRPYLLDGKPVEVETNITVSFKGE